MAWYLYLMSPKTPKYQAKGISLKFLGWAISIFAVAISALLVVSLQLIWYEDEVVKKTYENYLVLKEASSDMQMASDYLTDQVRLFVVNNNKENMDNYFYEANFTKRRHEAKEMIHDVSSTVGEHEAIHDSIETAFEESMQLMNKEFYAMKLVCTLNNIPYSNYDTSNEVANADISGVDASNMKDEAYEAVFGNEYMNSKRIITTNVDNALDKIDSLMHQNVDKAVTDLRNLVNFQTVIIAINVIYALGVVSFVIFMIIRPMNKAVNSLVNDEAVNFHSNREFNYLAETYNRVREQNEKVKEKLLYEAEHDKLTGLYNRTGYDALYRRMRLERTIFILVDIDKFKEVNDSLGHEMGDKVLIRTAETINRHFKDDNAYAFRIGGDEFAILVENAGLEMNEEIVKRCQKMDEELSQDKGKIPGTTLSIGVAHGSEDDTTDTLFRKADKALYEIKQTGRNGVSLYK